MAFEVSGIVIAEGLAETLATDAAMELMPMAMESLLGSTFEGAAFALPEAGTSMTTAFGADVMPAAVEQAMAQEAQAPLIENAITGNTNGINQVASANNGVMSDVGGNPTYDAWKNAIDNKQFIQENPLSNEVLQASGNAPTTPPPAEPPPPGSPSGTGLTPKPAGIGTQTVSPGTLSAPSQPYGLNPGAAPGGGISGGPMGTGVNPSLANLTPTPTDGGGFMQGFNQFVDNHPFLTGAGIYGIASSTGMLNQKPQTFGQTSKTPFNNPYHFSSDFQGSHPDPRVYKPSYASYAGGGITSIPTPGLMDGGQSGNVDFMHGDMYPMSQQANSHYATPSQMPTSAQQTLASYEPNTNPLTGQMTANMASGGIARYRNEGLATSYGQRGDVYGATNRFLDMYDPASRYTPPPDAAHPEVGIFSDTNPATRDKSALEAATMRQNAIDRRSQVNPRTNYAKPTVGIGKINVQPQTDKDSDADNSNSILAASGGIMGYNLGGYASGGNPRLLRGPGDGMSDNIPATIGNRQPARLADGEFVVPADVVSGLGNGSTEAGAKKLHGMMDKVRVGRTGKKKQAPAIKADKYIPK